MGSMIKIESKEKTSPIHTVIANDDQNVTAESSNKKGVSPTIVEIMVITTGMIFLL